jgi:hypothetical protein
MIQTLIYRFFIPLSIFKQKMNFLKFNNFTKMKKNVCAIYALLFVTSIAVGQIPIFSLDADKGFNSTIWQDQSGNSNHVSLSSTSKTADGVYFNGNNSAMLANPIPLSNFTIYMTLKVQELDKTLLGNGQPSEYGLHYQKNALYTATDQPFSFFNSNALILNKNIVIALSRDVTKNSGNTALYIDGALVGTFTAKHQKTFNLTNLSGEAPYLFKGWMKKVSIYNVAHTPAVIMSNSSNTPPFVNGGGIDPNKPIYGKIVGAFNINADLVQGNFANALQPNFRSGLDIFEVELAVFNIQWQMQTADIVYGNPYQVGNRLFIPYDIDNVLLNKNTLVFAKRKNLNDWKPAPTNNKYISRGKLCFEKSLANIISEGTNIYSLRLTTNNSPLSNVVQIDFVPIKP